MQERGLTARQESILLFIRTRSKVDGYPPTLREIGVHFGIWPNAVVDHIKALERHGAIRRGPDRKARAITVVKAGA